jgi:hypothetical protein
MNAKITEPLFEELDRRESEGIEVALLWSRSDDSLSVFVCDTRTSEAYEIAVSAAEALDAFRHPYAYAAFRGLLPARDHEQTSIAA